MNPGNRVEIVDRDGWRKDVPLEKLLFHVGSDGRNDIVLAAYRGTGVAPRHLQLVALPGNQPGYRAINLGDSNVVLRGATERSLAPHSALDIADGDCVQLGEFTLIFRLAAPVLQGVAAPIRREPATMVQPAAPSTPRPESRLEPRAPALSTRQTSASIGLRLALPQPTVDPNGPLEGIVTVQNLGQEPGVQFRLKVEGLETDQYEIGPGPILFPGVEKGIYLRIIHPRGPAILAGKREVTIRATAPEAYPGESVAVAQAVEFLPYYHHTLRLVAVD